MIAEQYRSSLEANELLIQLGRLLLAQRQADRLICRYLADLADGMGKWPQLMMGYGDVYQLVRARFGLSTRSIRERIRVGRALRTLPLLESALMSGRLTYSKIREVTRVAKPDTERVWLEAARRLSMRALESRVREASGGRSPDSQQGSNSIEPAKVSVNIPNEVWALLKQAMQVVKATCDLELTDAEALAKVARSALAHEGAVPAEGAVGVNENAAGPMPEVTHGGSSEAGGMTHGGSSEAGGVTHGGSSEAGGMTHGGSSEAGGMTRRYPNMVEGTTRDDAPWKPLSPDAQLMLDQVSTGGLWNAATLCDATGLSPQRLACAWAELEAARLVKCESFGLFEEVRMSRTTGARTVRPRQAG